MNSIGTAWIFVLLVIVNLDIAGRALFNRPIRGVPEVVAMSIVASVFLQLAHTLGIGRLTRTEAFLGWLKRKRPRTGLALEGVFHLVGSVLCVIFFYASFPLFTRAWTMDEYVGAHGDFMAPIWPVKLVILAGCVAAAIEFFLVGWRLLREAGRGEVVARRGAP